FLFSKDSKHADIVFKVKIELHNKIYEYSFSYNQDKINYESLILTENNKKRTIFYRNESGVRTSNKLLEESVPKLRDNSLFLYLAQSENHPESSEVYRSEEHTSELQSRFDLVCRLLHEKKKNNQQLKLNEYNEHDEETMTA